MVNNQCCPWTFTTLQNANMLPALWIFERERERDGGRGVRERQGGKEKVETDDGSSREGSRRKLSGSSRPVWQQTQLRGSTSTVKTYVRFFKIFVLPLNMWQISTKIVNYKLSIYCILTQVVQVYSITSERSDIEPPR